MEKKHILNMRMKDGREMVVETDDLREVLQLTGFGVGVSVVGSERRVEQERVSKVKEEKQMYRELVIEQQKQINQLQEQLQQMSPRTQSEVVRATRQPAGGDVLVAREGPQQQSQPVAPVRSQMTRQKLPQSSPMDVSPEQMQQAVWEGMTPQQQQAWMQKWNPQR